MEKLKFIADLDKVKVEHTKSANELHTRYPHKYHREVRTLAKYQDLLKRIDTLKELMQTEFKYEEKMLEEMFHVNK